jgi:TRAP-type uncharacterized transport system fused permease subunit
MRVVVAAVLIQAILYNFGIFIRVHLEMKKLGLRGLRADKLPKMGFVLKGL